MMKRLKLLSSSLFLFSSFGLCAYGNTPDINAISITTTTVHIEPLLITQKVIGSLESLELPTVASESSGRVLSIKKDIGAQVQKGDVLAQLDNELEKLALSSSQSEIHRLEALIENQRLTVKRIAALVKQKSQSQSMLDEASANLKALNAQLNQAKRAQDEATVRLSKTTIKAPLDGYVQKRHISEGDFVNIGTPIMKLVTTDKLRARFNLPETMRARLFRGQKVTLSSPTAPGKEVYAQINELTPMLDTLNRSVEVIVNFDNPGDFQPGSSVDGVIALEEKAQALLIPDTALVSRPNGYVVYEIEENIAHERPVRAGYRIDGKVEILGGLQPDVIIAQDGAGFLDDNSAIRLQG